MNAQPLSTPPLASRFAQCARRLSSLLDDNLLTLLARLAIAGVFLQSGRTKVDGLLTVSDSTYSLFSEEYQVPLLPPQLAAQLATYAEHLLPLLLVLGLFTRVSALGLLAMTAVIQLFVYPDAWTTHLVWVVPMLLLVSRGGGAYSLDRRLGIA